MKGCQRVTLQSTVAGRAANELDQCQMQAAEVVGNVLMIGHRQSLAAHHEPYSVHERTAEIGLLLDALHHFWVAWKKSRSVAALSKVWGKGFFSFTIPCTPPYRRDESRSRGGRSGSGREWVRVRAVERGGVTEFAWPGGG